MKKNACFLLFAVLFFILFSFHDKNEETKSWIRINQLGYTPAGIKVAVWCSKNETAESSFSLVDSATGKIVFTGRAGKNFGAYGPFTNTYRLDFSAFKKPGIYYIRSGNTSSPVFRIDNDVYKG